MAAGHIVNGQCVGVAASSDIYWSNFRATAQSGPDLYLTIATKSGSNWQIDTTLNGAAYSSVLAPTPGFSTCDTSDQFFDAMTLGWGVAAAMVASYAIHLLRRALQ